MGAAQKALRAKYELLASAKSPGISVAGNDIFVRQVRQLIVSEVPVIRK